MLKFAFLINVGGATPETYSAVYENAESYNIVAGVDGLEAGREYVKKLAADGFTLFNLCGDFDDEITEKMRADVGADVKIRHADYSAEELEKLNKLEAFDEYGIIITMDGVETPQELHIENEECNTTAVFVKDMDQAKEAAKKLVGQQIGFIELCSWYDKAKTEEIIDTIGGAVPVGTCGELNA